MAEITVERTGDDAFRVRVVEASGESEHQVTARAEDVRRYGGGVPAEDLIEASFAFLLEREPKEAILRRFELPVIEHYFPEYAKTIRGRLSPPAQ